MQDDVIFQLKNPSLDKIKEVLIWANSIGKKTDINMVDCYMGFTQMASDRSFSDVMNLITPACVDFFRIILRRSMNVFGIISKEPDTRDVLEISVRGIGKGRAEYLICIYLQEECLEELQKMVEVFN